MEINLKKPRLITLQQLQGFARTVIIAGDEEYVTKSLQSAAELKDMIKDRSMCIIPLVLKGTQEQESLESILDDPEVRVNAFTFQGCSDLTRDLLRPCVF